MIINIIKSYRYIVAVCDSELIGKRFEEDEMQLDVKESFFMGKKLPKEEVLEIMKDMIREDATFNIVGKKSVETALEAGIILKEGIREIQGVPFAMILI